MNGRVARNHKELICWQLCAQLRSRGLTYIRKGGANRDWDFRGQIRRAMRSNCYLTSEGFYLFNHKPFAHFLDRAYASLGETLDQIDDGHEHAYFTDDRQTEMRRLGRRAMKCNRRLAEWLRNNPDPPESQRPQRPSRPKRPQPQQPSDHPDHA
jgi:four helix bundle protein